MFKTLLFVFVLTVSGSAFAGGMAEKDLSSEATSIEIPEAEVQSERLMSSCSIESEDGSQKCSITCKQGETANCSKTVNQAYCGCN